ncbi:MAG: ribonuclease Z [Chloroflexi bacterium]|nr:ribonuclease Z [Chloroflexota bacterium]
MIEIVFLGTSASAPSVRRGLPSTMIMHRDRRFLIDAGEGTQRQLLRSGLGFKRLDTVLLTHGHLDHILGLGGIASTFARWEAADHLDIHGGRWALERVRELMAVVVRGADPGFEIRYHKLSPGLLMQAADLDVTAFPVKHRGSGNFGYVFEERVRRPFLPEKAEALGLPAGPIRRDLVQGKPVTLPDGRRVEPEEVLGDPTPGTKLVFIGDVGRVNELVPVVRAADLLVCESTYLWEDRDTARQFGHLTARQAAELARDAGATQLILTHVSRRYPTHEILAEARAVFPATLVADDLQHFAVYPGRVERLGEG